MKCVISHHDTCLPDYADRSYSAAIPVDCHTTVGDVIAQLAESDDVWQSIDGRWTDSHEAAFQAAIEDLRRAETDRLDRPLDPELPEDDGSGESVYAYFSVTFDGT